MQRPFVFSQTGERTCRKVAVAYSLYVTVGKSGKRKENVFILLLERETHRHCLDALCGAGVVRAVRCALGVVTYSRVFETRCLDLPQKHRHTLRSSRPLVIFLLSASARAAKQQIKQLVDTHVT